MSEKLPLNGVGLMVMLVVSVALLSVALIWVQMSFLNSVARKRSSLSVASLLPRHDPSFPVPMDGMHVVPVMMGAMGPVPVFRHVSGKLR